jgi:hypothetical protein
VVAADSHSPNQRPRYSQDHARFPQPGWGTITAMTVLLGFRAMVARRRPTMDASCRSLEHKKMRSRVWLGIACAVGVELLFSAAALAQGSYQDENEIGLLQQVYVTVYDEVTDGCLPQPDALKAEAELVLRRSGISMFDGEPGQFRAINGKYALDISVVGFGSITRDETCAFRLDLDLYRYAVVPEGHLALIWAYRSAGVGSFRKTEMQEQLRSATSGATADLASAILKARHHTKSLAPRLPSGPPKETPSDFF